ncbi:GH39 family glycosyl hydrolase [Microbacterium aurum]
MTSPRLPRRPHRRTIVAVAAVALAAALVACTGSPTPAPSTTTPPPQYPAQPDFAPVLQPAEFVPTADSTTATFTASYADAGVAYDQDKILNASQGGYATMTNPRWFIDRLPQISELGIKQVRIDHVLNDKYYHVVTAQPDGTYAYDFTRLDAVVDAILAEGMQPLIALSYTPSAFGKRDYRVPPLGPWAQAVEAVVSHYVSLGHTGWDWEVWNEPDYNSWSAEDYISVYRVSAPAVKAADPTARVGGATASYYTSEGDISPTFIKFAGANRDVPVDFFSVHSYSSDNWDVVDMARADLTAAGLDIPIQITEWALNPTMNLGPGNGSDSNSSPTGAAYVARRLSLGLESGAERLFYFSPVEGLSYWLPYNGDLGLLTVDGHRKSAGNVFEMYSHLGDTVIPLSGTGTATENRAVGGIATKDSTTSETTVLLWNTTGSDAAATVKLTDLPYSSGAIRVTQRMISGTQGNGYFDSSTAVMPSRPSPNENAPVVSDTVVAGSRTYSEEITIPATGVVEVRISPTELEEGDVAPSVEPAVIDVAAAASGAEVTASSSNDDAASGWSAAAAIDGRRYAVDVADSAVRGWRSAPHPTAEATESITVDFGTVTPIDSVSLWPYTTMNDVSSGYPVEAAILGSADGEDWSPLAAVSSRDGNARVAGEQTFSFDPVEIRYVKVEATTLGAVTGAEGEYAFQLAEIEAHRTGVRNGGFETGDLTGWTTDGEVTVQAPAHRGAVAAQLGSGASVSTEIQGLRPATTYTVGVYAKPSSADEPVTLTVDLPASGSTSAQTTTANWQHRWVTFTTGSQETSATITLTNAKTATAASVDDVTVSHVVGR